MRHRLLIGIIWALTACACAGTTAPSKPAVPAAAAPLTFEQKMAWILRLEDQRVLKDPAVPAADLTRLLTDGQARVRRRAALAVGRVGLTSGVAPLVMMLGDNEPEVRQMAAFALGLIGDRQARDPLVMALSDGSPLVQSSAAEALGLIGDPAAAAPIGRLVAAVVESGAVTSSPAEADEARRDTPAAAFRLGMFALVRLKAYEQLSAAVLDPSGQPRVRWWPVAFALQRLEDKRALPALLSLASDNNPYTRAFAVKGLGALKDQSATAVILPLLSSRDTGVLIEAIRALGKIGDPAAAAPLLRIVQGRGPQQQRVEAVTALSGLRGPEIVDNLVDAIGDRDPQVRAAALKSASTVDPEGFVTILSGLDPDPDWRARAALGALLGDLPRQTSLPRLIRMLEDSDQRVIAAVLTSLVKIGAPNAGDILLDHLKVDDPVVRASAASGIGELRLPAGAQALPAAYQFGLRDSTYVARAAAIEAFAKYGISVSRSLLDAALADKDWAVRVRAAALLKQGDPASDSADRIRPAPTRMTPDSYQSITLTNPGVSTQAFIDTDRGTVQIEFAVLDAPLTVDNFIALARRGFYNGLAFHRVVSNFVVQGGDPRGDGEGGPGYTLRNEISQQPYQRGTVGIALDWADTGGSQFFVTLSPQPHLDGRYTVFGRVIAGMDVVDKIQQGDVIRRVRVWDGQQLLEATPN